MAIAHLLEDFASTDPAETPTTLISEEALEDQRLAAFEKGYTAGWEDALQADAQSRAQLAQALAQSVEDASFTYGEALAQMQSNLGPLFDAIIAQLCPTALETGLAQRLAPVLRDAAIEAVTRPVIVAVAPGAGALVTPLLPDATAWPVVVREDDQLLAGQARLHIGDGGRDIDLVAVADDMRAAFDAFLLTTKRETGHERSA